MSSALEVLERYVMTARGTMNTLLDIFDECARQESATTLTEECELVRHWKDMPEVPMDPVGIALFADASVSFIEHVLTDHPHYRDRATRAGAFENVHRQMEDQLDACFAEMTQALGETEQ